MKILLALIILSTSIAAFARDIKKTGDSYLLRCKDHNGAPSGFYDSAEQANAAGADCPKGIASVTKNSKALKLDKKE